MPTTFNGSWVPGPSAVMVSPTCTSRSSAVCCSTTVTGSVEPGGMAVPSVITGRLTSGPSPGTPSTVPCTLRSPLRIHTDSVTLPRCSTVVTPGTRAAASAKRAASPPVVVTTAKLVRS